MFSVSARRQRTPNALDSLRSAVEGGLFSSQVLLILRHPAAQNAVDVRVGARTVEQVCSFTDVRKIGLEESNMASKALVGAAVVRNAKCEGTFGAEDGTQYVAGQRLGHVHYHGLPARLLVLDCLGKVPDDEPIRYRALRRRVEVSLQRCRATLTCINARLVVLGTIGE